LMHKLLSDFEKFDQFKFVVLKHEKMWKPSWGVGLQLVFKFFA
jgi:hypothetical protein